MDPVALTTVALWPAFLAGLLGSVHCLGMCGGIVGAFTLGLPAGIRQSYPRLLPYLLGYNAGRLLSYVVAGLIVGWIGGRLLGAVAGAQSLRVGVTISGVFLIALGLYIGGWWRVLIGLERVGAVLWRHVEPLGRRFLPPRSPMQAIVLGMVWGWLPCGLVYSTLVWTLAVPTAADGAQLMLAFGLGTLPMLLMMGVAAERLARFVRQPIVRSAAALVLIAFGVWALWQVASGAPLGCGPIGCLNPAV
ncbi:MAG: sulfite exporter TauE/SafE family protein [Chromatiales bacterium]|nr:sulfite exporter TauE/SafE family protein [Chromatiales bacterium]